MMTVFGIIMPIFAWRPGEFGSGVQALRLMTVSFALAQSVAASFMGSLAARETGSTVNPRVYSSS
jgi:hypothetical protein